MCSVHVCSAVTCHLYFWQNNQDHLHATMVTDTKMRVHRMLTLEKNSLLLPLLGLKPVTFRSQVQCSIPLSYPCSTQSCNAPDVSPWVWSTEGPVNWLGVEPVVRSQSKSSPPTLDQVHMSFSKSQSPCAAPHDPAVMLTSSMAMSLK